jgi:5-methylcytosine-specific restriction endonuclease McrA
LFNNKVKGMSKYYQRSNLFKFKQKHSKKKVEKVQIPKKIPTKNPSGTYDPRVLLLVLQNYIRDHKTVTDPADREYVNEVCKESHINPEQVHKLTKGEIRLFWLYLMNHGELICDLCGNHIDNPRDLTYDHRVPHSKGGHTDAENGKPAHKLCNNLKGNILPDEWEQIGDAILMSRGIPINYNMAGYNYRGRQNVR